MKVRSGQWNMDVSTGITYTPIRDLVEEFETLADNGVKADPRLGYCIYQTGDLYNNGADTVIINNDTLRYWETVILTEIMVQVWLEKIPELLQTEV